MTDGKKKQPHYFIGGIGGSGMLPLAVILKGRGCTVSGSDRSYDQGRTPEKFDWLKKQGIHLFPQDGSGLTREVDALVISKAVEDSVPDVVAAKSLNVPVRRRADLLVEYFNAAKTKIAVSGTSGKTTTTGMIAYILKEAGLDPSVMNGGIFRDYASDNPYATAFVGQGDIFVTEVDESDGAETVASYQPDIAVLHNITLDHQPMDELRSMFSGFLARAKTAVLNADDKDVMSLAAEFSGSILTYSMTDKGADLYAQNLRPRPGGIDADLFFEGRLIPLRLHVPGRHNVSNALAALSACIACGMTAEQSIGLLSGFTGIKRRMEITGSANGVTVIDDFAHNPDKVEATLSALHEFPGRLIVFFQPHGYGFLKVVGHELAESFARNMSKEDSLIMVEPFYAGGTVDRSIGASDIAKQIERTGQDVYVAQSRDDVLNRIVTTAKTGDRVVIMGARDDTLSAFAKSVLAAI